MMVYKPIEIKEVLKRAPFVQGIAEIVQDKLESSVQDINIDQPIRIPREADSSNYESIKRYFGNEKVNTADNETLIELFIEELKCYFEISRSGCLIRIERVLSTEESNIIKKTPVPSKLAKYYDINRDLT